VSDFEVTVDEALLALQKMAEGRVHRDQRNILRCRTALAKEITRLQGEVGRMEFIRKDPEAARHLLRLLLDGKGTKDDFDTMIDRLIESRDRARERGGDDGV